MDASEGTGERRGSGKRDVESGEGGGGGSMGDLGGTGAEIPRALTSFARRWGGMGERGRGQDGRLSDRERIGEGATEWGSDASRRWADASCEVIGGGKRKGRARPSNLRLD